MSGAIPPLPQYAFSFQIPSYSLLRCIWKEVTWSNMYSLLAEVTVPMNAFSFKMLSHLQSEQTYALISVTKRIHCEEMSTSVVIQDCVSKSVRTGRLERELQMVQLSATRCSCIAILWVSLVSFAAITLCVASQRVFIVVSVYFVIDSVRKLLDTPS
jgi:hypothetical protein